MFKVIIFGLWETLGSKHFSASNLLREHFNIDDQHFLERYEKSLHLREWEAKEDMAKSFLREFSIAITKENLEFVSEVILRGVKTATLFGGVDNLLESLSNYRLVVLSNTTNFESKVLKKWGISQYFEYEFYPWKTQILKPSKESFLNVCRELNVEPKECIFIDNENRSIAIAKELGFLVIPFENSKNLDIKLKRLV